MKKSLLKVAASIVCLLGCNAAMAYDTSLPNAPVMPVNNGLYYIFDAHGMNATTEEQTGNENCRYAFRHDNNGTINGSHFKPYNVCNGRTDNTTITNNYVWKAVTADNGATWSFQNVGTQKWIKPGVHNTTCTTGNENEKGLFVINGTDVNALKVLANGTTNTRWDGNGTANFPMACWNGVGHPYRFYEAVSDGENGYKIASTNAWNVTYTFTTAGNETFTRTVSVGDGENPVNYIPAVDFFTSTGLQEGNNATVSETSKEFNVTGTWNFPVNDNTVYRLSLRPEMYPGKVVSVNAAGTDIPLNVTAAATLSKTALWYFDFADYDDSGKPILTMHSLHSTNTGNTGVSMAISSDNQGNERTNGDWATASLAADPTQFVLIPCSKNDKQDNDFCLKALDFGDSNCFVNARGNKFSTWSFDGAHGDAGSVVRAYSLTDTDYDYLAYTATDEEITTAKANPTPEAISALIGKFQDDSLAQAIFAAETFEGTIGTGLGQYNNGNGDFEVKLNEAKALMNDADATDEAKTAAISTITLSINQPKAGRFYRFRYGNSYLSSTLNANNRFSMVAETITGGNSNLNNTTVFYYDGTHLVTYPEGKLMGNLSTSDVSNGSMSSVIYGSTYAGTLRFDASAFEIDKYNIISTSNNRYLYHNSTNIDSGRDAANSDQTGYRWEIIEVTWLPVPVDASKTHFSVCVPVDLNITQNQRAEAHTGVIQGANLGLKAIEGAILAANTPAVLEYIGGAAHGCAYFQITGYPAPEVAAAAADATNSLTNTNVYAAAKDPELTYFTIGGDTGDKFMPYNDDTLPAFAAILSIPTTEVSEEQATNGYTITEYNPDYVSITEIEDAGNNGKQVIYDLQGRRVQRASKGIYIIDGVKTLVK